MKALLRRLIPESARTTVRRCARTVRHFGTRRVCPVCSSPLAAFAPHGNPPEEEAVCPICQSKAPHRLAGIFFCNHPELFQSGGTLLHVAPEPELQRVLQQMALRSGMTYRCGSITGSGETYLDLRQMDWESDSVHLVYCCHVLNMIDDDRRAMRELLRVLHPQGTAILQVPAFYPGPGALEGPTEAERRALFHDPCIFRQYSRNDFEARLKEAGFQVSAFRAAELPPAMVQRHALKQELLHVCRKPVKKAG